MLKRWKELHLAGFTIVVVDKHQHHLFTPALYEVATSEQTKPNVTIPLSQLLPHHCQLIHQEAVRIMPEEHQVVLGDGQRLGYDYLVVTVGSENNYHGIPGLADFSLSLKSEGDGVQIRDAIDKAMHEIATRRPVRIVVVGGGFAGVELTAELIRHRRRLIRRSKSHYPIDLTLVQGPERLLPALDARASHLAMRRFHRFGVSVLTGLHLKSVTAATIILDNERALPYDLLIWTGGVRPNGLVEVEEMPVTKQKALAVDRYLRVDGREHVFAAGDIAAHSDRDGQPLPAVGEVAEQAGRAAGRNVAHAALHENLEEARLHHSGYLVPHAGRYAIVRLGRLKLAGALGWVIQQFVLLRYLYAVLPVGVTLRRWIRFEMRLRP